MQEKIFYNYVYLDPRKPGNYNYDNLHFDFEPFYVGKGQGDRCYFHLIEVPRKKCNYKKFNKIRKIKESNLEPIILKIYENLEESIAFKNEIYLIETIGRHDKGLGPLSNLNDGGKGGDNFTYNPNKELIREKMVKNHADFKKEKHPSYGKHMTDESKQKNSNSQPNKREIYQYSLDGILIKKYNTLMSIGRELNIHVGDILSCCNGYLKTVSGFFWSFTLLNDDEIINRIDIIKNIKTKKRKIIQYDLNNNYINEFNSIREAARFVEIGHYHIINCLKNRQRTAGNFIWKYKD